MPCLSNLLALPCLQGLPVPACPHLVRRLRRLLQPALQPGHPGLHQVAVVQEQPAALRRGRAQAGLGQFKDGGSKRPPKQRQLCEGSWQQCVQAEAAWLVRLNFFLCGSYLFLWKPSIPPCQAPGLTSAKYLSSRRSAGPSWPCPMLITAKLPPSAVLPTAGGQQSRGAGTQLVLEGARGLFRCNEVLDACHASCHMYTAGGG